MSAMPWVVAFRRLTGFFLSGRSTADQVSKDVAGERRVKPISGTVVSIHRTIMASRIRFLSGGDKAICNLPPS